MSLAATQLRLAPAEALAAVTVNAAHVLGRADRVGRLVPGHAADLVLVDAPDWRHLAYHLGGDVVRTVVARGSRRLEPRGILGRVPTRKQRRRRAKEQRHEYEVVYVDDEGNEVEVDPDSENDTRAPRPRAGKDGAQPLREPERRRPRGPEPPTWQRSARRALIMAPFFFAFLYILQRDVASALVVQPLLRGACSSRSATGSTG